MFRPARRSEAKPLIVLYSESGCGKTVGALLLARGFSGSGRIGMIDTESGRGEAYADDPRFAPGYDVAPIRDEFSPEAYERAIRAAEKEDMQALIIDSGSHEWMGPGGILDLAAQNEAAGKRGVLVWQQPKMRHGRHFIIPLLTTPIPLVILCLRAKFPMVEKKKADGKKEWVRSEELEPVQADDILFEAFVHGWIDRYHRLHVTKLTRPDLAQVFRDGELITLETGQRLAAWSKGDSVAAPAHPSRVRTGVSTAHGSAGDSGSDQGKQEGTTDDRYSHGRHGPHPNPEPVAAPPVSRGTATEAAPTEPPRSTNVGAASTSMESNSARLLWLDKKLEEAATKGIARLQEEWDGIDKDDRKALKAALDRRHKPAAQRVDEQAHG